MEHSLMTKNFGRLSWAWGLNPYSNGTLSDFQCLVQVLA